MAGLKYDTVIKYVIRAVCDGPLHIGSSLGGKEEVLIHPVNRQPFIQASGIAGAFRGKYAQNHSKERLESLFGASKNNEAGKEDNTSRIKFTDGQFETNTVKMELRPHVSIDRETGSVTSRKGSGQKFDLEYIGTGAAFTFCMYVFEDSCGTGKFSEDVRELLAAMKNGEVLFGGKKSNGAGKIVPTSVLEKKFLFTNSEDRNKWTEEETLPKEEYLEIMNELPITEDSFQYRIHLSGCTEGPLLVKGIAVSRFGKGAPDSENQRNAQGDFIIPGSSLKGVFRSRMEAISSFLGKSSIIEAAFGKVGVNAEEGHSGVLYVKDTVVGDQKNNEKADIRHRIHIDKFTGGVFNQGLFAEKNVTGNIEMEICLKKSDNTDAVLGLLLMALRDLAVQSINVGSGYATGKGFLKIASINVTSAKQEATILFGDDSKIDDPGQLVTKAMKSLQEVMG